MQAPALKVSIAHGVYTIYELHTSKRLRMLRHRIREDVRCRHGLRPRNHDIDLSESMDVCWICNGEESPSVLTLPQKGSLSSDLMNDVAV
jgi:hypothetical protein